MHILYVEAHYDGAHRDWIDSYTARSQHQFTLLTMPGGDWRWRLHGGAAHLAGHFLAQRSQLPPVDLLLVNGMANAPLFLALTRPHLDRVPLAVYIQENQLNYPPPPPEVYRWQDGAVIQVFSAYAADWVAFNGDYLRQDFLASLQTFVAERDYTDDLYARIAARAGVLRRGIDLVTRFGAPPLRAAARPPTTFLWSHRWAYEKGVEDFAAALRQLHAEDLPFYVILAGDPWNHADLRASLAVELGERVLSVGNLSGADYVEALRRADVMVACSLNEPLGVSMLEAMYMGCLPILPNRGSFPVILPPEHHDLLYDGSREQLIERMRQAVLHPIYRPELSAVAAAYDWAQVVKDYDRTWINLVENR